MKHEKQVYTVKEAAKILNIGNNLAYKLVKQNVIPALRLGRRLVVPAVAIDELLNRPLSRQV